MLKLIIFFEISTLTIFYIFSELQTAFIHSDDTDLKGIILKMILDPTISADTIKVILEFVRMDSLTDIISELLNGELNK